MTRQTGRDANTLVRAIQKSGWNRLVSDVKRQISGRASKAQETVADKAARTTARATVWMAVFTLVLGLTNLGTIWILVNQLNEMHTGGIDTHALAEAAKKQALAAESFGQSAGQIDTKIGTAEEDFKKMATNSEGAIKATQEAMRQDQRAWVGLMQITGLPEVGKPYEASALFSNSGKTPAAKFTHQARSIVLPKGTQFVADYNAKQLGEQSFITLFPNQFFHDDIKASNGQNVAQSDLDLINSGTIVVYVFGRSCYDDVFGKHHWQRFCDLYDPAGKTYLSCSVYNEIDTEKTSYFEDCKPLQSP